MVCLMAIPALAQKEKASKATDFQALTKQLFAAYEKLDVAAVAPFFAKEPELVFYDVAPMKFTGWAEYEATLRGLLVRYNSLKITAKDDFRATQRGNVAWGTATIHISGQQKSGNALELDGRYTVIWEKRGKQWLIVHEHYSVPR
jgi:ketosteroid isomerase-like protein